MATKFSISSYVRYFDSESDLLGSEFLVKLKEELHELYTIQNSTEYRIDLIVKALYSADAQQEMYWILMQLNCITSPSQLSAGRQLLVPSYETISKVFSVTGNN